MKRTFLMVATMACAVTVAVLLPSVASATPPIVTSGTVTATHIFASGSFSIRSTSTTTGPSATSTTRTGTSSARSSVYSFQPSRIKRAEARFIESQPVPNRPRRSLAAMAQEVCSSEIWTDAHGVAAVTLPALAEGDLVVEVRALADGVTAAIPAQLRRRRFTVATSEPHVKVAWRVTLRRSPAEARPKEEQ